MGKRFLCMVLAASMTAALFGCGRSDGKEPGGSVESSETAQTKTQVSEAEGEKVNLKWAMWNAKIEPYWSALAQAYEAQNPNVTIELVDMGDRAYLTVLGTELSGSGTELDVVTFKTISQYATLVSKGVIEPLDSYIEQDQVDLSVYNGQTEQMMIQDELYQLPFRSDLWLMFYNKKLFDDAGVPYPVNGWTISEYKETVKQMTKEGFGTDRIYGAHYHTNRIAIQLFALLDGKQSLAEGNYDFLKETYEMVRQQEQDGYVRSYVDTNAAQLNYKEAFAAGTTAMVDAGSWFISVLISNLESGEYDEELCGDWGIVTNPRPDNSDQNSAVGTLTGIGMVSASAHKEEAWDFMQFICGSEGASIMASAGAFPAILNDDTIGSITSLTGFPEDEQSRAALKVDNIYLEFPYCEDSSELLNVLDMYHQDIMLGDKTIDEGIAALNSETEKILGK